MGDAQERPMSNSNDGSPAIMSLLELTKEVRKLSHRVEMLEKKDHDPAWIGFYCDGCGKGKGLRYHCTCGDFDFCHDCYLADQDHRGHEIVVFKTAVKRNAPPPPSTPAPHFPPTHPRYRGPPVPGDQRIVALGAQVGHRPPSTGVGVRPGGYYKGVGASALPAHVFQGSISASAVAPWKELKTGDDNQEVEMVQGVGLPTRQVDPENGEGWSQPPTGLFRSAFEERQARGLLDEHNRSLQ
jgi:hypothetical protein